MNFGVGVTFFYPSKQHIKKIDELKEVFDYVVIFDNSEKQSMHVTNLINDSKVEYYFNGINEGLSVAYNFFLDKGYENNIDFLCLLDQDSEFEKKDILKIINYVQKNSCENIGVIAPNYSNLSLNNKNNKSEIKKVNWVINSGSFINLSLIQKYQIKYDTNYFIDRIDADFCKQLSIRKIDIIVKNDSVMHQELGYIHNNRSAHSPFRHYYMFRDRLYFNKKFLGAFRFYLISILQSLKHLLNILAYEDLKKEKIKACYYGGIDFSRSFFGKSERKF